MAQLIVEGTTKRVVQDLPKHEKISYSFSESHWCTESTCQELMEWLGAWVRKQGFLHWVRLWDCASVHRKASLLEWIRTAHPECHVLFIPGGHTAEPQPANIAIQQSLKHSIKQQAMAHWVLHARAEAEKNTSITTKAWRHLSWTFEEAPRLAARATREHLDGTLLDDKRSHRRKRTSSSMTTTTMTVLRIPRARGQLLLLHLQLLQKHPTAVAEASEPFPTVAAEVARAERFLYLRCAYGKHPPKP